MKKLIFAWMAAPGGPESQALMLADSLRAFGGVWADCPVWVLVPERGMKDIAQATQTRLAALDVCLTTFEIDPATRAFPFARKVFAAAAAESTARGQADGLVWMDCDSIVVNEPTKLCLNDGKVLGYRPVDHTLIGSLYDEPIDPFWALIYRHCNVSPDDLFPMTTSVDEHILRPYFNAGMLVVRPEVGLLQAWRDRFDRLHREPDFEPFYAKHILYRIFMHQAVLAGVILSTAAPRDMQELSYRINYPLHMHADYPAARRPARLNELITCRYDTFFQDPQWEQAVCIEEPLKGWLLGRLK